MRDRLSGNQSADRAETRGDDDDDMEITGVDIGSGCGSTIDSSLGPIRVYVITGVSRIATLSVTLISNAITSNR